jgi:hypothetical protein
MSTKPLDPKVPMPAIVTETPVPDGSVTFHERRTFWPPPIVTLEGFAVNDCMLGGGQEVATTLVCAADDAPQPLVAVSV